MAPEALEYIEKLIKSFGAFYSVVRHERLAPLTYAGSINGYEDLKEGDALICFSRKSVLSTAALLEKNGFKASVIYGALPPESRRNEVRKYLEGETTVVVATDAGSSKKAYKYSHFFDCPLALIDKRRDNNNDKAVATNIIGDIKGKTALIFDDEVSTAGTLVEAANILKEHGAKEIYAGAAHGVLVGPAIERIKNSPIKELVVTNTIPIEKEKMIDKLKVVSIAPLFAEAIKRVNEAQPLGDLFEYDK